MRRVKNRKDKIFDFSKTTKTGKLGALVCGHCGITCSATWSSPTTPSRETERWEELICFPLIHSRSKPISLITFWTAFCLVCTAIFLRACEHFRFLFTFHLVQVETRVWAASLADLVLCSRFGECWTRASFNPAVAVYISWRWRRIFLQGVRSPGVSSRGGWCPIIPHLLTGMSLTHQQVWVMVLGSLVVCRWRS